MESDIKVNEDLKSQFKAYQEQQQRRLQNVLERKKEKQNSQKDNGNTRETLRSPNDLNLLEIGEPVNEDGSKRFLEAENEKLQDQLREVRDENCRLYKLVAEKDFEIKQLQKKVQEDRLALAGTSDLAGDVAAAKIVELAKKNREITAESESERAKVKQLNHKVKELERELQAAVEKIHSLGGAAEGIKKSTLKMLEGNLAESPEVKALQEKLNTANFKVMEYRNQLQSSKQELKMTQKLLANEIGEDVNIQSLLANSGSWRGRAQQILVLQNKVRELEIKLGQTKTRRSLIEIDEDFLALEDPSKLSAQEKHLLKLRSLEKEKKEALERLSREHDALQKSHEEVKKKLDASKARNRTLCGELKILKGQIVTLLEKGQHDDELIDALLSQQKQMQEILKDLSLREESWKMGQILNSKIQKQNSLIEQLRELVAERGAKVQMVEEETEQHTPEESAHGGEGSGAADTPPEHSEAPLAPGSSEVGRSGSAWLPGPASPEWEVLQTQMSEHRALCQAAEGHRNRLLELVAVLQSRMEESSSKALEAEKRLEEEQWQSVLPEQQLEELQTEPGKSTTDQKPPLRGRRAQSQSHSGFPLDVSDRKEFSESPLSTLPLESQVEELSKRLVIQLKENKALQAALESTVRKKEEDFKLYQDTMEQVKNIFLQAIQQQKQEMS
ncbi:coiled-coil domain-containing protein 13 isoform X2 [Pithys albifrons albifrons]|uniref:coiled-coil domain-containing protein 13 isoform X2 n=1 Tax=Pithys albifrons albifrons TaxID=3385563 RepID=UPI003A5CC5D3